MSSRAARRRDAARLEMYRRVVLEAAERVFAAKGFERTRMREIAAEAGISLSTLYGAFDGKTELFEAIQQLRSDELFSSAEQALGRTATVDFFLDGVAAIVEYLLDHPEFLRIQLRSAEEWSAASAPHGEAGPQPGHRGLSLQEEIFRRGIEEGVFLPDDPARMARLTAAIYHVHLADWLDSGGREDRAELIARIRSYLRRAFCREAVPD